MRTTNQLIAGVLAISTEMPAGGCELPETWMEGVSGYLICPALSLRRLTICDFSSLRHFRQCKGSDIGSSRQTQRGSNCLNLCLLLGCDIHLQNGVTLFNHSRLPSALDHAAEITNDLILSQDLLDIILILKIMSSNSKCEEHKRASTCALLTNQLNEVSKMANNQFSSISSEAATTEGAHALPELWISLSSMTDEDLEKLERAIGELLAARRPESKQSVQPAVADAINRIRMSLLLNSFFVFSPPASLDEPWAQRAITSIKRALHRLTPAELISIQMFLSRAADVPLPDVYTSHIAERAEQQRQAFAQEKAKRGGRR